MNPSELLADISARRQVAVVMIRGGFTCPDGSRPIAGATCTVPGTVAAKLLQNSAADLAAVQP
jgi:hypothetical protein